MNKKERIIIVVFSWFITVLGFSFIALFDNYVEAIGVILIMWGNNLDRDLEKLKSQQDMLKKYKHMRTGSYE